MKSRYRLNDLVAEDLDDIWSFIASDDPQAVRAFIKELFGVFRKLSDTPRIGRQRDEFSPGLRSFLHGNYVIFYHIKHEYIEITRVLHGARDLHAIFHPDD